jgi:hypothetical protein
MVQRPELDGPKLLSRPIAKLRIALAGGTTLAVGLWLAPSVTQTGLTTPQ